MADELSRLLSLISHEVRSPLGVVRGYLRLLQQGQGLTDQQQHAVGAALSASERAAEVLAHVSVLAQLHQPDAPFERAPVLLPELMHAATGPVVLPADRAVTLAVLELPPVTVLADQSLLARALTSLLTAVVRAEPKDATVCVSATRENRDGLSGVALTMSIDEPHSVERSEGPLDIGRGGQSLELPIAAHLVARHGGHIRERRDGSRLTGMIVWLPTTI